jgi:hypothetical protein
MFWLIIVLWIVEEHLIELFSILKDLDFWMIEIIILSIFNSKMFKSKTYLHQKLINYLNLMPIILKAISIVFLSKINIIQMEMIMNTNILKNMKEKDLKIYMFAIII